MSYTESRQATAAHRLIKQLLKAILEASGSASRVCFGVIGEVEPRQQAVIEWIASSRSHQKPREGGQPIADWDAFLPALSEGLCAMLPRPNALTRVCFQAFSATSMLVCPATDEHGRLAGALFILWDRNEAPPQAEPLGRLMAAGKRVGGQIAAVQALPIPF